MASDTPKALIEALDLITAPTAASAETLGRAGASHVRRVRNIFEDKNIIAVGISEKITEKKKTGDLSLTFYVVKKLAKSRLGASKLLPEVTLAPDGTAVHTDVKQIGLIVPQALRKIHPIQSGFSVAHIDVTAGTVGAIVKKANQLCILSNSHVLANAGLAKIKDSIVYPGPADKGKLPKNLAGKLRTFVKFKPGGNFVNRVDAALGAIDASRLEDIDFSILGVKGAPKTIAPKRGMKIIKRGRTSGETEGEIQDVNFRITIDYDGVGSVGFTDQVFCTRYSRPGDSGSIVVDKNSGRIVGLHFAGGSGGSVFNPIANVVDALKFTFVAK